MNNYITLNQEQTIATLKNILGENYCDWSQVKSTESLAYFLERMANDITHLKTDNQVWYDKSQELEQQIQTNQAQIQELENEVATHLEALKRGQIWSQSQAQEIQQKNQIIQQKEQTIANLTQTNQTQQTQFQETQDLNQKLQQDNQELLKDIHTYKQTIQGLENQNQESQQRILALEADKTDLLHQLTQAKQKHQDYLTQEKFHLTKEIQLIKEVIYV